MTSLVCIVILFLGQNHYVSFRAVNDWAFMPPENMIEGMKYRVEKSVDGGKIWEGVKQIPHTTILYEGVEMVPFQIKSTTIEIYQVRVIPFIPAGIIGNSPDGIIGIPSEASDPMHIISAGKSVWYIPVVPPTE